MNGFCLYQPLPCLRLRRRPDLFDATDDDNADDSISNALLRRETLLDKVANNTHHGNCDNSEDAKKNVEHNPNHENSINKDAKKNVENNPNHDHGINSDSVSDNDDESTQESVACCAICMETAGTAEHPWADLPCCRQHAGTSTMHICSVCIYRIMENPVDYEDEDEDDYYDTDALCGKCPRCHSLICIVTDSSNDALIEKVTVAYLWEVSDRFWYWTILASLVPRKLVFRGLCETSGLTCEKFIEWGILKPVDNGYGYYMDPVIHAECARHARLTTAEHALGYLSKVLLR